ncbi:MAG: sugar phosphate isomerase/epimerase family protein [Anaerolineae bacterium]|nr:sugar phosphate isomerase/epimerase [Anaerolineae bacterium]MDW8098524.1 sugar phosphate isomerase/epimerase family protein [Anaerolineae bacterium]
MFKNLSTGAIGIRTDLIGALRLAKAYGFAGIEFNILEAAELAARHGIDHVRHMFAEAGVVPGNFGFPVDFRKDEDTWRADLEALPRLARLARELGATRTATWILPFSDELPFAENFRWHVERLRPAAQILADHGIRLGLEFVGPATARVGHRYGFLHSLDGMLALCAAIGTDNLGLLLDSYHWHTSHGNLDDLTKLSNADVVVVHVNDALPGIPVDELQDLTRALPCETGVINLAGFIQALARIGYDGPVIVEPFSQRIREMPPDEAVCITADSLRQLWAAAGLESTGRNQARQ